ncbi:tripartite tricarboxylate transporter substrate binding protein [Roseomonas sp. OT10]|uniref:tripartite tricarboxylate transporter substrate binding protein n=1 Tax=Roseomonas cutis TaxID=2897332 RepID=UPI001E4D8C36|nr:tripartite tricarboxylate transporter substrate binding protein [Roseomonas sp. OT10]UFN49682.1 tripartite tricarboxylate transporter substrate binding protein [Roseomonas sp. OT10]
MSAPVPAKPLRPAAGASRPEGGGPPPAALPRRALLALPLLAAPGLARGQGAPGADWSPDRPIRIVVPYTAGGASDITARLVAERLRPVLGQPGVVENRPGASGIIGTDAVAKAPADGHTLAMIASSHVVNKALFPTIPYDPLADFAPVVMTAQVQLVMVVPAGHPARDAKGFAAWAKAQDGRAAYASSGNGSNPHIFAADYLRRAGVEMEHVPYRGSTAAHADLLAGRTQMMFDAYAAVQPHVQAGALRLLGLAGPRRSPLLPDLATIAEQGFPGYGATSWGGLLAPAGTPPAAVARLNAAVNAILAEKEVRDRLGLLGAEVAGGPPGEFADQMRREQARYVALVQELGIKAEG